MKTKTIHNVYHRLFERYGSQHWWPGDSPFEVIVGAILTQCVAWRNVEKAITNIKKAGLMSPSALRQLPIDELAQLIHPSGYYKAKSLKLKVFVNWLEEYCGDDLDVLFSQDKDLLRQQLLDIHGIGPETADSILLYAGSKPIFVIDAYTRRFISRLGLAPEKENYNAYQELFMNHLPQDTELFKEYHALLVRFGKETCRKEPICSGCCQLEICSFKIQKH